MKTKFPFVISFLLSATLTLSSCDSTKTNIACIDESKISEGMCTMQYDPVCGCDGKTYSNACIAGRAGVTSTTEGKCGEKID